MKEAPRELSKELEEVEVYKSIDQWIIATKLGGHRKAKAYSRGKIKGLGC